MFCSHCGAVIPDGSQFCPQCGGSCAEPQAPVAQPEVNVNDPQNIASVLVTSSVCVRCSGSLSASFCA